MRKLVPIGCGSLLLLLLLGCTQPQPKMEVLLKSPASIITEITSNFYVLHEAQVGQTLEWRITGSGKTDFWIFFGKQTPCASGETTLHGSAGHPASCVAGKSGGGTGTVRYAYELHQDNPPPGGYPDRINPCTGCAP